MDATSFILLLTQVVTLAAAVMGFWTARNAKAEGRQTKAAVHEVHLLMNSRLDELIEATRKNARAEGVIEGEGGR